MHVALATDPFQAGELGEWIGMIVDPQVEIGPILLLLDDQGRRLPAALVAPRGLARLQRRDQAAWKRQRLIVGVSRGRRIEHALAREHVAGDRERLARAMAAPLHASSAGVRANSTLR